MGTFYSPAGNPEVWKSKPDNYLTIDEWLELHPPEAAAAEPVTNPTPSVNARIDALEEALLTIMMGVAGV